MAPLSTQLDSADSTGMSDCSATDVCPKTVPE